VSSWNRCSATRPSTKRLSSTPQNETFLWVGGSLEIVGVGCREVDTFCDEIAFRDSVLHRESKIWEPVDESRKALSPRL
jgi:hypothetical protein